MINKGLIAILAVVACDSEPEPAGYQGVVELDERVLAFEVPGRVITMTVSRGELVDSTRVLATLDESQPRASIAVREAEAEAARERAKLVAAGTRREDIRALEAEQRAARANEELAIKRHAENVELVRKGALPQSIADESDARRKTATAAREALDQRLREVRTGPRTEEVAGSRAQATAAQAAVALESERAARYSLRALGPGEVLDIHVEPGEVVAAGTPVLTVGDTTHPHVDVFVPQGELAAVRVGARASIRVDATPQVFSGVVEHVSRHTEFTPRYIFSRKERQNLVVRTRVRIDDPQRALHAGTPAFVTIGT
jgi:HlyD family secretion protein